MSNNLKINNEMYITENGKYISTGRPKKHYIDTHSADGEQQTIDSQSRMDEIIYASQE